MTEWVEVLKAKGQSKDKISELESLIENVRNAKDELQQRNNLVLLRQAAHNAGMLNASQKTLIEISHPFFHIWCIYTVGFTLLA